MRKRQYNFRSNASFPSTDTYWTLRCVVRVAASSINSACHDFRSGCFGLNPEKTPIYLSLKCVIPVDGYVLDAKMHFVCCRMLRGTARQAPTACFAHVGRLTYLK